MSKVYLASSFALVGKVKKIADILECHHHQITREWWHRDYKISDLPDDEWFRSAEAIQTCSANFKAIDNADAVVLVASYPPRKFNGANIEIGYAIAKGKRVYAIGALERSAMYCPVIRTSIKGLLEALEGEAS